MDRLKAIADGQRVESVLHDEVMQEDPVLRIVNFNLFYGRKQALHNITMPIAKGKVTALIGPSGCGKSTLLRSVNRMNDLIDSVRIEGDMLLGEDSIFAPGVDVIQPRAAIAHRLASIAACFSRHQCEAGRPRFRRCSSGTDWVSEIPSPCVCGAE